jgi:hypothetical protein
MGGAGFGEDGGVWVGGLVASVRLRCVYGMGGAGSAVSGICDQRDEQREREQRAGAGQSGGDAVGE